MRSYRHLDPGFLPGHPLALEVLGKGLSPCPKRGKAQPVGSDARCPTYLYDWGPYPTVGTHTGPKVGILVSTSTRAASSAPRVDKERLAPVQSRWCDLERCLVSFHGGRDRGRGASGQDVAS